MLKEAKDVDLLALVIWNEARGESDAGKRLVAETVLERVRDPRWPDTIEEVLTQKGQFQRFDLSERPSPRETGWGDCVMAARAAMRSGPWVANHFHSVGVMPPWHDPSKVVLRSGGHVFLRL
jgi:N-acetylmuramoyl-L-alanine amidase